jgi:ABC-2 type transport system permease protein
MIYMSSKRGRKVNNLFLKTLYDKRSFIVGWGLGFAALGYFMTIVFPAFHQNSGMDELIKSLPPALKGFIGNLDNLNSLPTYLGSQLFNVRMPIFISILSIILSIGLTVGEEDKGQLRTLVGLPLSRGKILFDKWLAIVLVCLVATVMAGVGIELGLLSIHETLDIAVLVRLSGMTWLLAVALATLIFGIGLATGKRSLTTGLGVLVAIGSFLLTTFAVSVSWLVPYEKLSILHYFPAPDVAKGTVDITNILVYLTITVVFLVVGLIFFRRRDLRG